jgi:hypothetical protein
MTKDELLSMARKAGFPTAWISESGIVQWAQLERLVALARADEREGIAEMFDEPMRLVPFVQNTQGGCVICGFTPSLAAAVIRARGETK